MSKPSDDLDAARGVGTSLAAAESGQPKPKLKRPFCGDPKCPLKDCKSPRDCIPF